MKIVLKRKNNEFLVTPLKNILSFMGLINQPRIPKLWAIAHELAINARTTSFFVPLQNIHTIIFLVNLNETPKQWAIAHENGPKTQKQ
jgi:hypothetical protein